jgi:hypothetical protein
MAVRGCHFEVAESVRYPFNQDDEIEEKFVGSMMVFLDDVLVDSWAVIIGVGLSARVEIKFFDGEGGQVLDFTLVS